ncbi:MAG: ADP-ribosyltransferase [Candidatus Sedimenticola sp. (ex Thyasira tokunagai)]
MHKILLATSLLLTLMPVGYSAPPDFKVLMDTKSETELRALSKQVADAYIQHQVSRYRAHGLSPMGENQYGTGLNSDEKKAVGYHTDVPDAVDLRAYTPQRQQRPIGSIRKSHLPNVRNINSALDKLPSASGETIYSGRRIAWNTETQLPVLKEGDYLVNAFRPLAFTNSGDAASYFLKSKYDRIDTNKIAAMFTVENANEAKMIAPLSTIPSESEVTYKVGSAFRVKKLELAEGTAKPLALLELEEVDAIPFGSVMHDIHINSSWEPLSIEEISVVPEDLRVRVLASGEEVEDLEGLACFGI